MNALERIKAAVNFGEVDRVPVWPFIMSFAAKYAGVPYSRYCRDYRETAAAQLRVQEDFQLEVVTPDTDPYREAEGCGAVVEFPFDDQPLEKRHALEEKSELGRLKIEEVLAHSRVRDKVAGVAELKKRVGEGTAVLGWVESPFQNASILRGLNRFMIELVDSPGFVKELLEFTTELAAAYARQQCEAGAQIIGVGDAAASLISPAFYAEYVFPHVKRVIAGIKEAGAVAKYHICGNAAASLELISRLGADIVNIDHRVDLKKAREMMSSTCIKGNLHPVEIMLKGTPEIISREARECIAVGGRGYILSPGCELPRDTPPDNLRALMRAVH